MSSGSSLQGMFEPYLKSFYIRSTDPTQIKILKVRATHPPTYRNSHYLPPLFPLGNPSLVPGHRGPSNSIWTRLQGPWGLCVRVGMEACRAGQPGGPSVCVYFCVSWRSSPTWPTRATSPRSCVSSRYVDGCRAPAHLPALGWPLKGGWSLALRESGVHPPTRHPADLYPQRGQGLCGGHHPGHRALCHQHWPSPRHLPQRAGPAAVQPRW